MADRTQRLANTTARRVFRTLAIEDTALGEAFRPSATGAVTLSSVGTASTMGQLQLASFKGLRAVVLGADAQRCCVRERRRKGVRAPKGQRLVLRTLLVWCGVLLTPLIGVIQGLSNLERIADVVPFLRPFAEDEEYAAIRDVVTGYIPVLLVLGLLAVIPYVLESLALNYVRSSPIR